MSAVGSYPGSRLNFRRDGYGTEAEAQNAIGKFKTGATADIAYDPADPNNSALDRHAKVPSLSSKAQKLLFMAAIFAAVGAYVAYASHT